MHKITSIDLQDSCLIAHWQDGNQSTFDYLWLRDNCPSAFDPDTKERNFNLLSISEYIRPEQVQIADDAIKVDWSEQQHSSEYAVDWLRHQAFHSHQDFLMMPEATVWREGVSIPQHDFQRVMQGDQGLFDWMHDLAQYGISLVNNMPDDVEAAENVAKRIGHLRETNFGLTFEVKSKPNPINLAYTAQTLPLHTDLPNQETPPGYQFLHCLVNSCEGGESVFLDGFKVAQDFRVQYPDEFKLLSEYKIPFRFHDDTCDIREMRPIISVIDGEINEIIFNAHIASTFNLPSDIMRAYYLAYRRFIQLLNEPAYRVNLKLEAGQMVVFDNRRTLHGRNAFDPNTGNRFLKGCYVDRTEFKSKYRILCIALT